MADPDSKEHFNNQAAAYERSVGGATRVIARHLASLAAPIKSDARILDNATGTGILIEEILASIKDDNVSESIHITAADQAPTMIEMLKGKASSWKINQAQLDTKVLTAEDLGSLPDDTFDLSFTVFGFMFFKDPEAAAKHVYRTLKPGGTAYVTTWADVGYLKAVNVAGSRMGKEEVKMPFGDEWWALKHLNTLFGGAGFKVDSYNKDSVYTADSIPDLTDRFCGMMNALLKMKGWSEQDIENLRGGLEKAFGEYKEDELKVNQDGVKMRMIANIAICRK